MFLWTLVLGVLFILWLFRVNRDYVVMAFFAKRLKTVDGTPLEQTVPIPRGETIFQNVFDVWGLDAVQLFQFSRKLAAKFKRSYLQYGMGIPFYNVITAEDAELVLGDQNLITKGIVYNFLHVFIRTGLLTATDKKWHSRRKMLTPAFHFNILGQFEEVFKEESQKFVSNWNDLVGDVVVVNDFIPKFTLNSVCETALGVKLDDRLDDAEYRASFKTIEECFVKRIENPFYMNDTIFNLFLGRKYQHHLKVVHEFSSGVIEKKRQLFERELKAKKPDEDNPDEEEEEFVYKKKRYAMLDTLLRAERENLIDHIGICEEVDTFMFEGFDTTSMGLTFSLMNLSLYPDMQERCYNEILENVDDDLSNLDITQLSKLKYLECFIKETLRLYPSVPVIMRQAVRDTKLENNLILPPNTQVTVHIFDIHRSPKYFKNPNVFDPERFTPENSQGRHPFAYIPFSAGQRNCIGQKFAMLEIKTLIVHVLKNFKILPAMDPKDFAFETGLIIRTKDTVKIKLAKRN